MTGKRFKWCKRTDIGYVDEFVVDTFTNKELDEEDMCDKLNELASENEQLKSTLAFRSNQLALMESLIDDLGSEEMKRQMMEILND